MAEREPDLTGEILLREVTDADLPIFFEQQLDPEANYMAAFTAKNPADREAFNAHWERIQAANTVNRTIVSGGLVVGYIGGFEQEGKPEVTYWLGKEYWGKGIAGRALSAFLNEFTVRPIYARAASDNVASIRVLEKNGFRITGYDNYFANARNAEIEEALLQLNQGF